MRYYKSDFRHEAFKFTKDDPFYFEQLECNEIECCICGNVFGACNGYYYSEKHNIDICSDCFNSLTD